LLPEQCEFRKGITIQQEICTLKDTTLSTINQQQQGG